MRNLSWVILVVVIGASAYLMKTQIDLIARLTQKEKEQAALIEKQKKELSRLNDELNAQKNLNAKVGQSKENELAVEKKILLDQLAALEYEKAKYQGLLSRRRDLGKSPADALSDDLAALKNQKDALADLQAREKKDEEVLRQIRNESKSAHSVENAERAARDQDRKKQIQAAQGYLKDYERQLGVLRKKKNDSNAAYDIQNIERQRDQVKLNIASLQQAGVADANSFNEAKANYENNTHGAEGDVSADQAAIRQKIAQTKSEIDAIQKRTDSKKHSADQTKTEIGDLDRQLTLEKTVLDELEQKYKLQAAHVQLLEAELHPDQGRAHP